MAHKPTSDTATRETPLGMEDPRGHAALIERLYVEHNAALLRFLTGKLGSQQEAKEIAQEAYVRLLSLHTPGAISYLRAFLYKTASNLAMDRLRSRTRHGRLNEFHAAGEMLDVPCPPEAAIATEQEIERLHAALDALPHKCREAFLLHKFYGLSMVEVAQRIQVTDRMVRLYITRALLHCRRALETTEREEHRS